MQEPQGGQPEQAKQESKPQPVAPDVSLTDKLPPEAKDFLSAYWTRAKVVFLSPRTFFDQMPTEGGYEDPMKFLVVGAAVYALMQGVMAFNPIVAIGNLVASFGGVWLAGIAANFLAGAMGGKGSMESTIRVYSYSTVNLLYSWIPVLGLLGFLYTIVLNTMGLSKVHQLGMVQSAVVVLLTGIAVVVILGLLACSLAARSVLPF